MGLMAERGAQRRRTRQTYRTMARMQRRRSFVQSRLGTKRTLVAASSGTDDGDQPCCVRTGVRGRTGAARPAAGPRHPQRRGVRRPRRSRSSVSETGAGDA